MAAPKDRFWAKVLFRDFIRHYRKMTPEERAEDIEKSMDALEDLDENGSSFGSKMVFWATHRAENYPQASENGKKGGRPKKDEKPKQPEENGPKPDASRQVRHGTKPFGKFGNVYLTDDEYAELGLAVGNQNELNAIIDTFGASLEDGSRTSTNHYATLTKWVQYRKDKEKEKEEQQNARNETYAEREGRRQIEQLRKCGLLK